MNRRPQSDFPLIALCFLLAVFILGLFSCGAQQAAAQTVADLDLSTPAVYEPHPAARSRPVSPFQYPLRAGTPGRTEALLWTATALLAVDWLQTRDIATNPRFAERNPVLGPRPDLGEVNRYFAGAVLATWAAGYLLPEPWNDRVLLGVVAVQGVVVSHNLSAGVRWRF